jgi:hypothetical protein
VKRCETCGAPSSSVRFIVARWGPVWKAEFHIAKRMRVEVEDETAHGAFMKLMDRVVTSTIAMVFASETR